MEVRVCPGLRPRPPRRRPAVSPILSFLTVVLAFAAPAFAQTPRGGSPSVIPGTIQAEDFDDGGQGVAYFDWTFGNDGGAYRSGDVDIEMTPRGGYDVGWAYAGEWLLYTVNVTSSGNYTVIARVASNGGGGTFHIEFNGQDVTGQLRIPDTGGWQAYQDVPVNVTLSAGVQRMRVVLDSNGSTGAVGNFHFFRFEAGGSGGSVSGGGGGGGTASDPAPFGGSPLAIPGSIQAADFDNGGEGLAYHDNSPGNNGGAYRATDVDIESGSEGADVGWIYAGEWLRYTVNVASGGDYQLVVRVASAGSGGTFHVEFNGQDKTGAIQIPNTGGWQSFQDARVGVTLDGGVQSMRIVFDSNGATGGIGNISSLRFDAGSAAPAPAPAPAPPPSGGGGGGGGGGRLRVMSWNINFGYGSPWGQAQLIADSGADVALLQEASTFDEDMPTTYPDRLRSLTGQTWYASWNGNIPCAGGCQGTLILSKYPFAGTATGMFDGTPVGWVAINVGGVRVNLFDVHLEYYDTSRRWSQLLQFMSWAQGVGGPTIAGGDFNSWWGEPWISQMETQYSDTWQDVTGSVGDGYTLNGAVRFDYLFRAYDGNWRLTPTACWVQYTGLSDHSPVIADYTVR